MRAASGGGGSARPTAAKPAARPAAGGVIAKGKAASGKSRNGAAAVRLLDRGGAKAKARQPDRPERRPDANRSERRDERGGGGGDRRDRSGRSEPPRPANLANPRPEVTDAVPTDQAPRKNQAGLSPRDLQFFRDLLLGKRREVVGDMADMEREALRSSGGTNLSTLPLHMADMGTDNYEQEFTLGLVEKDRQLLREINAALARIQNGSYGMCEGTGKPIGKPRLEAQPWTRYSIEYARQMEKARGR